MRLTVFIKVLFSAGCLEDIVLYCIWRSLKVRGENQVALVDLGLQCAVSSSEKDKGLKSVWYEWTSCCKFLRCSRRQALFNWIHWPSSELQPTVAVVV